MTNARLRALVAAVAREETEWIRRRFLAPRSPGGRVRVRIAGLISTCKVEPGEFEGWAVFVPRSTTVARVVEAAPVPMIARYLALWPKLRLVLVRPLRGRSWLALAANAADQRQRFGAAAPVTVHLVDGAAAFETVIARCDGAGFWFEEIDRRADPRLAAGLRTAEGAGEGPDTIRLRGLTPEQRRAYAIAVAPPPDRRANSMRDDRRRVATALGLGGGELHTLRDQGDYWVVEWSTPAGASHTSAIAKSDLTVISAGICLSDRDSDFDLESLVGVVEQAPEEAW